MITQIVCIRCVNMDSAMCGAFQFLEIIVDKIFYELNNVYLFIFMYWTVFIESVVLLSRFFLRVGPIRAKRLAQICKLLWWTIT